MFKISKTANPNYLATICKVPSIEPIPNADVLVKTIVAGRDIVTSKSTHEGDIVVYFPLDSVLCSQYLACNNLYNSSHAELNVNYGQFKIASDEDKRKLCGCFNKSGEVRIVKLRGVYSQGYIAPVDSLKCFFTEAEWESINWDEMLNKQFDTIKDTLIVWKNVPKYLEPAPPVNNVKWQTKMANKRLKKIDKIIPDQFKFHYDTTLLEDHIDELSPSDVVTISVKIHGTSAVFSNVLCNRKLTWIEKIKKYFKIPVKNTEYSNIYSSHHCIKNRYIVEQMNTKSFYEKDIYGIVNDKIYPLLDKGMTVYGEICGYIEGTSTYIQKNHDYGCVPGHWKFMPYRITYTDNLGNSRELNLDEVAKWTKEHLCDVPELMIPVILYHGKFSELYPDIKEDEHWRDNVLQAMKKDYFKLGMEMREPLCNNKVPREGVVIRKDNDIKPRAWKLKTNAHYALTTKNRDAGVVDMEEMS